MSSPRQTLSGNRSPLHRLNGARFLPRLFSSGSMQIFACRRSVCVGGDAWLSGVGLWLCTNSGNLLLLFDSSERIDPLDAC